MSDAQKITPERAAELSTAIAAIGKTDDPVLDNLLRKADERVAWLALPRTCENGFHDFVNRGSDFKRDRADVGMPGMQGTVYYSECARCGKRFYSGRFA